MKSRISFNDDDIVVKVYHSKHLGIHYPYKGTFVIDETSLYVSKDANYWLTENCAGPWGVYLENIILRNSETYILSEDMINLCKPYFGFQNKDDALLFKLTM